MSPTRLLPFLLAALACALPARAEPWKPADGLEQVPLWPGTPPGEKPSPDKEETEVVDSPKWNVGGRPWLKIKHVSKPTLTLYPPKGEGSGAVFVVFPGGGYNILAVDLEGTEICDWLTSKGIACALLKYRVPCKKTGPYRDCLPALQDAQRAVRLLRARAQEWKVDPAKIGVIGFSAGGHMVAALSTKFEKRLYKPVDALDEKSARPDFAVALYPGHLAVPETKFVLNPDNKPGAKTPPTLLIHAEDDPVDPVENSLVYHDALRKAGVPVELHLFASGKHAFGLRKPGEPVGAWPGLTERWLTALGAIPARP